ncbi:MAG TPA: hypothetical protein VGG30_09810, partial [Pirellulales bacterium]
TAAQPAVNPASPTLAPTEVDPATPPPPPPLAGSVTDPNAQTAVHSEILGPAAVPRSAANVAASKAAAAHSTPTPRPTPPDTVVPSRFIKVEDQTTERSWYADVWSTLSAWQTLLLLCALAGSGAVGWIAFRPASADALYAEIDDAIDPTEPKSLLKAEPAMRKFLARFPDDPRAGEISQQLEDAEELRAQRKLEQKNRRLSRPAVAHSPAERAYREALFYKTADPDAALARFQALLDLYGHDEGADENEWIRLARAEVAALSPQLAEDHSQDLAAIAAQLAAAEAARATDPAAAQKIWQAIVTLYGDKPWASRLVDHARAALAGTTAP